MWLNKIADDTIRQQIKSSYCVLVVFPDEDTMDVFMQIAERQKLVVLAKGTLKNAYSRMRRFVYNYVEAQRTNLKKYREDLKKEENIEQLKKYKAKHNAHQKRYYKKHKKEINENKRFNRVMVKEGAV